MKNFKRILSVLVCVCMLASMTVGFANAEDAANFVFHDGVSFEDAYYTTHLHIVGRLN